MPLGGEDPSSQMMQGMAIPRCNTTSGVLTSGC